MTQPSSLLIFLQRNEHTLTKWENKAHKLHIRSRWVYATHWVLLGSGFSPSKLSKSLFSELFEFQNCGEGHKIYVYNKDLNGLGKDAYFALSLVHLSHSILASLCYESMCLWLRYCFHISIYILKEYICLFAMALIDPHVFTFIYPVF